MYPVPPTPAHTLYPQPPLPTRPSPVLGESRQWKNGPDFLLGSPKDWPAPPALIPTSAVIEELRKEERVFTLQSEERWAWPFSRFSTLRSHLRTLSFMLSWAPKWKGAAPALVSARALQLLVQFAQREKFVPLQKGKKLVLPGFETVPPFIDQSGLWRANTRLQLATNLPYDVKFPMLLPAEHDLVRLVVLHLHADKAKHHGGVNYTLALFRQTYWTPKARSLVTRLVRSCVICKKYGTHTLVRPQAPLPVCRLPELSPQPLSFASTGMDCAGPFKVKIARSYHPYYLLLLTCCHFRAVRLEFLTDLSASALKAALTRAAARGVNPTSIVSDNGANFVATRSLLLQLVQNLQDQDIYNQIPHIKWLLNTPYASHRGGVFERMVGAAKAALLHAIPSHSALTLEQLVTAFAQVEAVLNARPLSYTSTDADSLAPLTPNHFLYGSASQPLFDAMLATPHLPSDRRWALLQQVVSTFLKRFEGEILPALAVGRKPPLGSNAEVAVGDVVTFFVPKPYIRWPLAVITETFPGKDGIIRTVSLRSPHPHTGAPRFFTRDVRKITIVLPANTQRRIPPTFARLNIAASACVHARFQISLF